MKYLFLTFSCIISLVQAPIAAQDSSAVQTYKGIDYTQLDIADNSSYETFEILLPEIDKYNVFFTGENHLFRNSNYKLQLKMMKYLHQKRGVNHLLLEFGFSRGYLVNQYVQTGDSTIFKMLNDYSYEEYAKLYKGLRDYNETLDSNNRIYVHGIDIERSYLTSVKLLNLLMPDDGSNSHDSIALDVEAMKSLMGYNDKRFNKKDDNAKDKTLISNNRGDKRYYSDVLTMKEIMKGYDRYKEHYKSYLGNNFLVFDKVMCGLKSEFKRKEYEAGQTLHAKIFRETYMFNEFLSLIDSLEGERFFSQFGRCHTATEEQDEWCNFYHFKTLASRISNSKHPALKDKVCSVATYYPKSEIPWDGDKETEGVGALIDDLKLKDGDLTLIKVLTDTSVGSQAYFKGLSNKFQFVIINNNTLEEDFDSEEEDDDTDGIDEDDDLFYDPIFLNMTVDARYHYFNLDAFNENLVFQGLESLNNILPSYGGSITIFENWYLHVNTSFSVYPKNVQNINDSTVYNFSGWQWGGAVGIELTENYKFNLAPYAGIGIALFDIDIERGGEVNTTDGFFSNQSAVLDNYRNWGALLDVGFDCRLNLAPITIALKAGYQLDGSNQKWRLNGIKSDASPKTSFSAPYVSLGVGFCFKG